MPGGYQILGQKWQAAGATEVLEETGVALDPTSLRLVTVVTTPDLRQNLLFCRSPSLARPETFAHDDEVSEVLMIHQPVETAFPLHTELVRTFFGVP